MNTTSIAMRLLVVATLGGGAGTALAADPAPGSAQVPGTQRESGSEANPMMRGGTGPMMHDHGMMPDHPMMQDDATMGHGMMGGGMMGGGRVDHGMMGGMMGGGMGEGMMGDGRMEMMDMMRACGRMMNRGPMTGLPRLPAGNEKLQLQMQAEMMQKIGEILGKYAARIPDAPRIAH